MRVVLWLCWGAMMFGLAGLGAFGWVGLLIYFVVGYVSGIILHRTMVEIIEKDKEKVQ